MKGYDPDAGRYAVAIDGGETVRVKPANLEPEPAPAPVSPLFDGSRQPMEMKHG